MNEVQIAGGVVASLVALGLLAALLISRRLNVSPLMSDTPAAPGRDSKRFPPVGRRCWSVTVEVARLRVDRHGHIAYDVTSAPVTTSTAPDRLALELSGLQPTSPGAVIHATSWRYEDAGHLVLTYAALPCPLDLDLDVGRDGGVLQDTGILCSPDP